MSGTRIYSDNPAVARFLQRTIEVLLHKPFADESLPITEARFIRAGNSLSTVGERVVSRGRTGYIALYRHMELAGCVLILAIRHRFDAGYPNTGAQ